MKIKNQFSTVDFQNQYIANKKNCEEKTSGSQSFERKLFLLLETILFSGSIWFS